MDLIGDNGDDEDEDEGEDTYEETEGEELGEVERLPPPRLKKGRLRQVWKTRKHLKKRRKYLEKGYVEWYLVSGTWPEPKFVKPENKGRGILEVEHDGQRYLFPREAMMPGEKQGGRVVVHLKGDSDPVNLRDPMMPSLNADEAEEWLDKGVTTSSPGFFDALDWDITPQKAMILLIGVIVGGSLLNQFLGGGL